MSVNNIEWKETDIPVVCGKWHVRPNKTGALAYKYSRDESALLRLSGYETMVVALCDGKATLSTIKRQMCDALSIDHNMASETCEKVLKRNDDVDALLISLDEVGDDGFTLIDSATLLKRMASWTPVPTKASRLEFPLSLVIIPSFQCHTNCIYCYSDRPDLPLNQYMPVERWEEVLHEAGQGGMELLTFSGGDPLTYDGIERLVKVAAHHKMNYLLPTKTYISEERAAHLSEYLRLSGEIQVSVDSFDPEIAEKMTKVKDYAFRASSSIANLRKNGVVVRTNTVVTPYNLESIELTVRKLRELGVDRSNVTNYSRSFFRHDDHLFLTQDQIDWLTDKITALREELNWPKLRCNADSRDLRLDSSRTRDKWDNRASCSGGSSSLTILPDGNVVLCEQVPQDDERFVVGNVRHQSIREVWYSDTVEDFMVPDRNLFEGTVCENCNEFDKCHRLYGRCFRDAFFTFGSLYAPAPSCPRAPAGMKMS